MSEGPPQPCFVIEVDNKEGMITWINPSIERRAVTVVGHGDDFIVAIDRHSYPLGRRLVIPVSSILYFQEEFENNGK